ncbi:PHP domain-containing protein [Pseudokineococcus lusitanus]|uniref:DNA polymerase III subunit alpha n=1 Tax=Pseudokineococcus lusitanus TaxID=763993 RepID=A0A3N1HKP4_9ACTN|nr:PHP domain-containing protein [Pseudokineococcus lusitanus]ROP43103.1 error-prone DNA polymerase [Pseudokineococcus lusitanus]
MAFPHLRVASGYSLRHGASSPDALVARAAELDLDTLALTDRDGLYGAVKHVTACSEAGIAPVLGVDLAVEPSGLAGGLPAWADPGRGVREGTGGPARGGAAVDARLPRVTVLAHAGGTDADGRRVVRGRRASGEVLGAGEGWAALCRLVSATHLRGERGTPVTTPALLAAHAEGARTGAPALTVLLGPGSEVGRAVLARRDDVARAVLARWYDLLPLGSLAVEVVCHDGPPGTPGSLLHAGRMLALARSAGLPAVLTGAVRYARPEGARTADVLDAVRRLVPLDLRHLDRTSARGHLTGTAAMTEVAARVEAAAGDAGPGPSGAPGGTLLRDTEALAARCRLDPAADLGIGKVHLPEASVLGVEGDLDAALRARCEGAVGRRYPGASAALLRQVTERLDDELEVVRRLGYPSYFLTVAQVCDEIRGLGVRVAARGSGAGSLVNHLLGVSGVEPLSQGLLMERFCTVERAQLPDIDVDVESARREEVYARVVERFGGERVSAVSMMDTYRVRHAVRDVGAALGMPPTEIGAIATAFPHVRARDARAAVAELPELRASGLGHERLALLLDLVEDLDALPRHVALHPCGVLLSDAGLGDRTPVEASWAGFPMSQFDKDDVEVLGLLKLDVLGIRMQSAMAHAVAEVERVDGPAAVAAGGHAPDAPYLDPATGRIDLDAVPLDDERTYRLVRSTRTLGCFQIESPGQRELVGRFAPQDFADLVTDISLFRPGPVKSDMITPFLRARQGWDPPQHVHPLVDPALAETCGVVVFHEQVIRLVASTTGVSLAEADEVRRRLGTKEGQAEVREQWFPLAAGRGLEGAVAERVWDVLAAFASFGFCKAHAAAFALPTYQSAWLKTHHPAAFLAGVLTHDPGMYPKRLVLDDARNLGIAVLGLDVNASDAVYRVERVEVPEGTPPPAPVVGASPAPPALLPGPSAAGADDAPRVPVPGRDGEPPWRGAGLRTDAAVPDARGYGIRLSLTDVKGISDAEVARVVAGRPYDSLADLWQRARPTRPVAERLVLAGALDAVHGIGAAPARRRGTTTRRDLLLQLGELERWTRGAERASRRVAPGGRRGRAASSGADLPVPGRSTGRGAGGRRGAAPGTPPAWTSGSGRGDRPDGPAGPLVDPGAGGALDVAAAAARQSQAAAPVRPEGEHEVQLALDVGGPADAAPSGLPEMTPGERVRAELEVLGLDASAHVLELYGPLLRVLGTTGSQQLAGRRTRSELLVAGVKVATQTPPIRSGRRVVFLTLDDSTGPVDATFFEDVQGPYAATVFGSWLLVVRGVLRRTGPRGVSLRATGAWDLPTLWAAWSADGEEGLHRAMRPVTGEVVPDEAAVVGAAGSRALRPVMARSTDLAPAAGRWVGVEQRTGRTVGTGRDDGALTSLDGPSRAAGAEAERRAAAAFRRAVAVAARSAAAAEVVAQAEEEAAAAALRPAATGTDGPSATAPRTRRVLVHASGFRQSPYSDIAPPGGDVRDTRGMARGGRTVPPGGAAARPAAPAAVRGAAGAAPRKLWHSSQGSSGR